MLSTVVRISTRVERKAFSAKAANTQQYLNSWLGNDLKGEQLHAKNMMKSILNRDPVTGKAFVPDFEKYVPAENALGPPVSLSVSTLTVRWDDHTDDIKNHFLAEEDSLLTNPVGVVLDLASIPLDLHPPKLNKVVDMLQKDLNIRVLGLTNVPAHFSVRDCNVPIVAAHVSPSPAPAPAPASASASTSSSDEASTPPTAGPVVAMSNDIDVTAEDEAGSLLTTRVHTGPVRSGQQLFANNKHLVVIGSVNSGGEVLADGDIHVYGALSGRAVAGLRGSTDACIYVQSFKASMVGITDAMVMVDAHPTLSPLLGKPVRISLRMREGETNKRKSVKGSSSADSAVGIAVTEDLEVVFTPLPSA